MATKAYVSVNQPSGTVSSIIDGTTPLAMFANARFSSTPTYNQISQGVTFNQSTGQFEVTEAGKYFVSVNVCLDTVGITGYPTGQAIFVRFEVEGSLVAPHVEIGLPFFFDGRGDVATVSRVLDLDAEDQLVIKIENEKNPTTNQHKVRLQAGTSIVMYKINGDFANAYYTANTNTVTTTGNLIAFSGSTGALGGSIASLSSSVNFNHLNGTFTPDNDRIFLYYSSWVYDLAAASAAHEYNHKLTRDGSGTGLQEVSIPLDSSSMPGDSTYMILKQVDNDQYAQIKRDDSSDIGVGFTYVSGTSFSLIDISDNGTLPSSFFSGHINSDSSVLSAGLINMYSETDRGSYTLETPLTDSLGANTGITLNETNGRFTFPETGDYLLINKIQVDAAAATESTVHSIRLNGTSEIYFSKFLSTDAFDPHGKIAAVITNVNKNDYVEFMCSGTNAKLDDGMGVVIIQMSDTIPSGSGVSLLNRNLSVFNSYDVSSQYTLETITQPPFILGARGYGITRKNDTAIVVDPGAKSNTDD
jgi:hypothetical protein